MADPKLNKEDIVNRVQSFFIQHLDIELVRLQWVDFTGIVRCRMVTVRQALKLAKESQSVKVASPIISGFLLDGSFNEIAPGAADHLVPDWSTLVVCHYQSKHAAVICDVQEPGGSFECCPRSLLRKTEQEMDTKHGIKFLVGVEIEFFLTQSPESGTPVQDVRPYCATASLRSPQLEVLEDAVRWIERADIPLWTIHSELVAGLYEISTEPMPPLQATDALVYIHQAIKTSALKHGVHATMHPKPFDKTHGVGQHVHISLSTEKKEESFLAGVLGSVPAISAISMPNFDSWLRRDFAGGEWVGWDIENRMSSIRKIRDAYWEFRFIDGTANTYLTLATILRVGMLSWEQGRRLEAKPMSQWPECLDDRGRKEAMIEHAAPRDLKEALAALKEDETVQTALGSTLSKRYIQYKEKEWAVMADKTLQERRILGMEIF